MDILFRYQADFNEDINAWDTGKVTSMVAMFNGCKKYNQPLKNWNMENVEAFNLMFYNAYEFNQPLGDWKVLKAKDFTSTFENAKAFNQDLCAWNTVPSFPYSTGVDATMFAGTSCTYKGKPTIGPDYKGPFCASYCREGETTSPIKSPTTTLF
jgi:surface protein